MENKSQILRISRKVEKEKSQEEEERPAVSDLILGFFSGFWLSVLTEELGIRNSNGKLVVNGEDGLGSPLLLGLAHANSLYYFFDWASIINAQVNYDYLINKNIFIKITYNCAGPFYILLYISANMNFVFPF